jgi:hypothetical protein
MPKHKPARTLWAVKLLFSMKYLLVSIELFFQVMVFAQDSEGSVKVTPALEKKFMQDIEKEVPVLSSELKKSDYNNLENRICN